jgi:hypothetical protein
MEKSFPKIFFFTFHSLEYTVLLLYILKIHHSRRDLDYMIAHNDVAKPHIQITNVKLRKGAIFVVLIWKYKTSHKTYTVQ